MHENFGDPLYFTYLCNFDSAYDFQSFSNKLAKTIFFAKINQ